MCPDTHRNSFVLLSIWTTYLMLMRYSVLIDIELVARTGGIRVLLHALADGPLEMAPIIASAFLYIVDSPRTRAYLHPGTHLEASYDILAGLHYLTESRWHFQQWQMHTAKGLTTRRRWKAPRRLSYQCSGRGVVGNRKHEPWSFVLNPIRSHVLFDTQQAGIACFGWWVAYTVTRNQGKQNSVLPLIILFHFPPL